MVIVITATVGVLMQVGVVGDGPVDPSVLGYFTVISNIVVALYFLADVLWLLGHPVQAGEGRDLCVRLKHVVLLAILVTGIIANTLLVGVFVDLTGTMALSMTFLHVLSPSMVLLDWLFLERKGSMSWADPFLWLVFPLSYFGIVTACIECLGMDFNPFDAATRFPYPFMDLDVLGAGQLALNVGGIAVAFLILGYILCAVDHLMGRHVAS